MARTSAEGITTGRDRPLVIRNIGLALGTVGLTAAIVAFVNALVAGNIVTDAGRAGELARLAAWGFGVGITAFALAKLGIATVLTSILDTVRRRAAVARETIPTLMGTPGVRVPAAEVTDETPFGAAPATDRAPAALLIHRMAERLWKPMLAMGAMAVAAGFTISLVQSGTDSSADALSLSAWAQGTLFLGEGLLLSGISFLLGSILGTLRAGGGAVQEASGVTVRTPAMPTTAKLFLGLMALGLMIEMGQFVAYAILSTLDVPTTVTTAFAWLGPVRELGLGVLLSGIVLALATIAKVLGFQFWRLGQIVTEGR